MDGLFTALLDISRLDAGVVDTFNLVDNLAHVVEDIQASGDLSGMGAIQIAEIVEAVRAESGAAKHSVFRAVQKLRRALEPAVSGLR